ncbi:hypothetical protein R1sor_001496 [Riccia sorocarpa]|uniref:Uncharacterized protein n=1 Tax=Riccia sorocarpa TaxID=122646 RepID=A0ABD3GYS1_9MARC
MLASDDRPVCCDVFLEKYVGLSSLSDDEIQPLTKRCKLDTQRPKSLQEEKDSVLQAKEAATLELQGAIVATESYKTRMESEFEGAAEAQLEKDRLTKEIFSLKFCLERAEKNQLLARQELAQARVQLRHFPVHEGQTSARDSTTKHVLC